MGPFDPVLDVGREAVDRGVGGARDGAARLQREQRRLVDGFRSLPDTDALLGDLGDVSLQPQSTEIDRARLLVDKCTFGPTPGLVEEVAATGPDAWLAEQLDPSSIPDPQVEVLLLTFPSLQIDQALRRGYQIAPNEAAEDVQLAQLTRAVRSERQLQEVMVGLWSDHFNTFVHDGLVTIVKATADAEIRSLALGRFEDLLLAVTRSPAMLIYLDNNLSSVPDPNENLGRELLELHSVGVLAGYTEDDVLDAARAITGWTVNQVSMRFEFQPTWHYDGPLSVLGWSHPGASGPGAWTQGEDLIRYLANHPATAERVASKIARRFVSDSPSSELVSQLAAAYTTSGTSIRAVLEALFSHPEFWASGGEKAKRPFETLAGALRALAPQFAPWGGHFSAPAASTVRVLRAMGHATFEWLAPDGYPDNGTYWTGAGTWLQRWNGLLALVHNRVNGINVNANAIRNAVGGETVSEFLAGLGPHLIGRPIAPEDVGILVGFTGVDATEAPSQIPEGRLRHVLALVLALPVAQVR